MSVSLKGAGQLKYEQIIVEIAVIYDSGIEGLGIFLYDLISLHGDHARWFTILRIYCKINNQTTEISRDPIGLTIMMKVGNDLAETLLSLFVKIRDSDSGSENSVIRMFCSKVCRGLRCEILKYDIKSTRSSSRVIRTHVQLDGSDALINASDHFLSDSKC